MGPVLNTVTVSSDCDRKAGRRSPFDSVNTGECIDGIPMQCMERLKRGGLDSDPPGGCINLTAEDLRLLLESVHLGELVEIRAIP